jgi:hypothetical protein
MLDKVGLFAGINGVRFCEIAPARIGEFLGENYKQRSFQLLVFFESGKKDWQDFGLHSIWLSGSMTAVSLGDTGSNKKGAGR